MLKRTYLNKHGEGAGRLGRILKDARHLWPLVHREAGMKRRLAPWAPILWGIVVMACPATLDAARLEIIPGSSTLSRCCFPGREFAPAQTASGNSGINFDVVAEGYPPFGTPQNQYQWSIAPAPGTNAPWRRCVVPPGLSIDSASGRLTGTVSDTAMDGLIEGASFYFAITVTNIANPLETVTWNYLMQIFSTPELVATLPELLPATAFQGYEAAIGVRRAAFPDSTVKGIFRLTGDLPSGLEISGNDQGDYDRRLISGTPAANAIGVYPLRFKVTLSPESYSLDFEELIIDYELEVLPNPDLAISTTEPPNAFERIEYEYQLETTGSVGGDQRWTALTPLPPNFYLTSTGILNGLPQLDDNGTYQFDVQVEEEGFVPAVATITFTIDPDLRPRLRVTTTSQLPDGAAGESYGPIQLEVENGFGRAFWEITSGSLPRGVVFRGNTATIAGTINPDAKGSFSFSVYVEEEGTIETSATFTIQVYEVAHLTIATTSLPFARSGEEYTYIFRASGGTAPYTWSSSGMPAGMSVDAASGIITGTPGVAGSYQLAVTATDSAEATSERTFTFFVEASQTSGGEGSGGSQAPAGVAASDVLAGAAAAGCSLALMDNTALWFIGLLLTLTVTALRLEKNGDTQ